MELVVTKGGWVDDALYEKKWSVEPEGWIWYGVSRNTLPFLQGY